MIAAAFWLASPMVRAAGLGQLSVISPLGQPLNAEIEIVSLQPGEEEGLVARLASPDAFRAAGIDFKPGPCSARLAIERSGRRAPRGKGRGPQRSQSGSRLPRKRERSRSRRATR